ncbi:PAS/PAC sensor signal transduction histidine kinase [Anaeromyxobacter dehalogenans 2CP-1]|uniref:histidine kinase n=1 Tax=Anaeromyxobacter dehalogenans (strain ATCC BAA-258 / DSM 21875 / 2CP-1) TaxID=455488 RepID=B8J984_ANAD2|nr:ATP-binding protein [Anaeromyxobacter dehalogenans]ACL65490.1 PAS/PAC sensor signal transduction histidine kinase [Anaeromyxobacter dehalogenans 2CP-1]
MERARRELRESRMPDPQLLDSFPALLDALVDALRHGPAPRAPAEPPRVAAVATEHGEQRAAMPVDVVQLVWEYGVVSDVILELAEEQGLRPEIADLRVLEAALKAAIAESVRRFVQAREGASRRADARLRAVADHAPAALVLRDREGRFRFVNRFAAEALGRPQAELLGRRFEDVLPPAVARRLAGADARAGRGTTVEQRETLDTPRGLRTFHTVTFALAGASAPEDPAIVSIGLDVTDAQTALERLRHADELLELGDAFLELDRAWRIVRVNRNQERLSQRSRDTTLGRVFWEVWPELARPESAYWVEYHRVMNERVPSEFEAYFEPLDMWTAVAAYPVTDGGVAVFFRDATRRMRDEQRLRQAQAFEQQLIGIVSHDLRNPLNAILLGASSLLAREDLSDRNVASIARIRSAAERAARLIRDLLDLTRARLGGGIPVQPRPADLRQVAQQVVDELEPSYPDRPISVEASGDTHGQWDPDRIAQVIGNLVTNALKYGARGTPVAVRIAAEDGEVRLSVHNQGTPIPAETVRTIFEAGGRAAPDPTGRSVGLGLFIVERIADAHGGRVEVHSSEEDGTTFTVWLPRKPRGGSEQA